ncbi:MAG: hypothetical protein GSR86_07380 [Desulfurococcales archaeon]|nr:hypothetical protein [Desulfurococcales archaeon]
MRGFEKLLIERIATALSFEAVDTRIPDLGNDPIVGFLWRILEARRGVSDRNEVFSSLLLWSVARLPSREVEASISANIYTLISRLRHEPAGFYKLAHAIRTFILKPSLKALVGLAVAMGKELARPCSSDPRLAAERDALESVMAKLGLIVGVVFSLFFLLSIMFSINIHLIIGMVLIMAVIWYLVRFYGVRYAILNKEIAWSECSIRDQEDLRSIIVGYTPMHLMADLLYGTRSRR